MSSMCHIPRLIAISLFVLLYLPAWCQSDTLIMNTGEILVGEIKGLGTGVVTIETDYSDSDFKVEWDKVAYIRSERIFIISIANGERFTGTLKSVPGSPQVVIQDVKSGEYSSQLLDLVFLKPVDQTFLSRLDLLMSVGYTLTRANNNHQFSGRLTAGYLSNTFAIDLSFNIIRSFQTADNITTRVRRTEGGVGLRFFIINNWFAMVSADLLQSSEQQLTLRSITRGGVGNYIVSTNQLYLVLAGGVAWNFEDFEDPELDDRNSAELFAGLEYNIFDIGDLDLKTNIVAYPGLTEWGRFRSDFSFDLKYEFPLDFFINLGFTLNYDNQPVGDAPKTDYVLQTTFGWEL